MNKFGAKNIHVRFQKPDQLQSYLENTDNSEFSFRAYPISGKPETFHHSSNKKIIKEIDGRSFDSLSDFTCYVFQCDAEGYSNTEYVDFEIFN